MSIERPDDLEFEKQLGALKPASHLIDSSAIVFEAGRQSVLQEQSSMFTPRRRSWPARIAWSLPGAVIGAAAMILILLSGGLIDFAGSPADMSAQATDHALAEHTTQPTVGADPNASLPQPSQLREYDFLDRFDDPGVLSSTGVMVVSPNGLAAMSPPNPREGPAGNGEDNGFDTDVAPESTYWQLMRSIRNERL